MEAALRYNIQIGLPEQCAHISQRLVLPATEISILKSADEGRAGRLWISFLNRMAEVFSNKNQTDFSAGRLYVKTDQKSLFH